MPGTDFVLEIGCEEIPSRFLPEATAHLKDMAGQLLKENRLTYGSLDSWSTPRRLVLRVGELSELQADITEKVKGPPVRSAYDTDGNPTRAAKGFARSTGVAPADLVVETIKGTDYVVAVKETAGKPAQEILPHLLIRLLQSFKFPRSMYWQSRDIRFARPVRWLLALYGSKTIPFSFGGVKSEPFTRGHRLLNPGRIKVSGADSYFSSLEEGFVVLDPRERKVNIRNALQKEAGALGGRPLINEELLEEVCFLVECPVVIGGSFSPEYLKLPREVLTTTMQVHQRFFPVISSQTDDLLPHFLGVSNNRYSESIRSGYEKVLGARLSDASFFFREDLRTPLEEQVVKLRKVVFLEMLGTMADKTNRVVDLVKEVGPRWQLSAEQLEQAVRAAHLCKADLVTSMVYEFPELQGIMGREYALSSGEKPQVALAIFEHCLPRFAGDELPSSVEGTLVSLCDKLDTLAGCFFAGFQPTGSQDPYALRRQALGVISTLMETDTAAPFVDMLERAIDPFGRKEFAANDRTSPDREEVLLSLLNFMEQRVRFLFQEKGISYDVADAVLAVPYNTVNELYRRAQVLQNRVRDPAVGNITGTFVRINNLSRKSALDKEVDPTLFREPAETELWTFALKAKETLDRTWKAEDHQEVLNTLAGFKEPVEKFFDRVMVMAEEENLRFNRLALLLFLKRLFVRFADFSLLQMQ